MSRLLATTALAGALLAAPAWAQSVNQGAAAPNAPAMSAPSAAQPQGLADQDRSFIHDAAIGGTAEVEAGKLAEHKGQAKSVRGFGRQMVTDHGKANARLARLAKADGVTLPPALDDKHAQDMDKLGKQSGAGFDRMYIHSAIDEHQAAVQLFTKESQSGDNADLKRFAAETLPTIQHHLQMAQSMEADMSSTAPQSANRKTSGESSGSSMAPRSHNDDNSANALNRKELQSLNSR